MTTNGAILAAWWKWRNIYVNRNNTNLQINANNANMQITRKEWGIDSYISILV